MNAGLKAGRSEPTFLFPPVRVGSFGLVDPRCHSTQAAPGCSRQSASPMTPEDRIAYVIGGLQGAAMTLDHKLIGGQKEAVADFLRELAEMLEGCDERR